MRGFPTRRGSRTTAGAAPDAEDAPATARLREAGAVLLGKTTTPELGWKAVTDNPLGERRAQPVGLEPHRRRLERRRGGRGGARHGCRLHLGTDGGGSIRIPAAFCGIVGLKPTFGRVPAWPLSPFGTVAHLGPMTRTRRGRGADADRAGAARRARLARPAAPTDGTAGRASGTAWPACGSRPASGWAASRSTRRSQPRSGGRSARWRRSGPGWSRWTRTSGPRATCSPAHWFPAAARVLAGLPPERVAEVDPGLRAMADEGAAMGAAEITDAQRERGALATTLHLLLGEFDLLATPAVAIPAFAAGVEVPDPARQRRWIDWAGFSYPFNLSQQPAISVPCGRTEAGLPIGLQLVARKYREDLVLRAALAFERAEPQPLPDAPRPAPV